MAASSFSRSIGACFAASKGLPSQMLQRRRLEVDLARSVRSRKLQSLLGCRCLARRCIGRV